MKLSVSRFVASFLFALFLGSTAQPANNTARSPLAASWPLDQGQGQQAFDKSSHQNHGKIRNANWVASDDGTSLRFTPSQRSNIEVPNSPSLDLAEMIVLELDVKTYGTTGKWQGLLAKRNDANQEQKVQYQLALKPDLELSYCVCVGGGNNWWYPSTGLRLKSNQWYHVTARYDSLLRRVSIYLDGKLAKILEGAPMVHRSANAVRLGWTGWSDEFLNGELRHVRIIDGLQEKVADLQAQGITQPIILDSEFLPHRFAPASNELCGILVLTLLNPASTPSSVTLRARLGSQTREAFAAVPACQFGRLQTELPESASTQVARVELLQSGRSITNLVYSIPGAQHVQGYRALLVSHTHSDLAWADSIPRCLDANVAAIAKSVELAQAHPEYRFAMEHTLFLREYLRRYPEQLDTIRRLLRAGNLEIGGFFTGPWELTCGPEGLVRELYLGKLWVKRQLGFDPAIVWNVDVAGHVAQLPQILHKAGVRGFVISAGADDSRGPALFRWQSRDGSEVLTWTTPWGYGASGNLGLRHETLDDAARAMPRFLDSIQKNHSAFNLPKIAFIADGTDLQSPTARTALNLQQWNQEHRFPPMRQASGAELFEAVGREPLPAFRGEMPSPWDTVQAQGNDCFLTDRHLDGRLLAAEKFAALASVSLRGFNYPAEEFDQAWYSRLFTMDHNWGGRDGANTAITKANKVKEAARITDAILQRTLESLAGCISAEASPRILVFNPLSWERRDAIACAVPIPIHMVSRLSITDAEGHTVPHQLVQPQPAGLPANTTQITFMSDVPSLGYATYYVRTNRAAAEAAAASSFQVDVNRLRFETPYFRLGFDPGSGAIKSIYDLRLSRELLRQDSRYLANELFAWEDDDVDIGTHLTGGGWSMREHPGAIRVLENGPVRLVLETTGRFLTNTTFRQQTILYKEVRRLDFMTHLNWAGDKNLQVYQVFPLAIPEATASYATPYGWEQFGQEMPYAAPWFSHDTAPVAKHRSRGIRGWIQLANRDSSVVLSTDCNYAAFKDLAPQGEPGFLPQPLLLRTVRSCGDDKLFYTQAGEHLFRFSLQTQTDPARAGAELDSPLLSIVVTTPPQLEARLSLPPRFSFAQVSPSNVQLAALKRAEDGRGLIARLVETRERIAVTQAQLQFFPRPGEARQTTLLEEDTQPLAIQQGKISLPMKPSAIETLRLSF